MNRVSRAPAPGRPEFLAAALSAAMFIAVAAGAAGVRPDAATALAGIDADINSMMEEWKVPGLAVAAIQDGTVVLARGYGLRNVEEGLPVTADTLFAIGSNSKSFTATVLGMLNDAGQLDWDAPVREVMTDFRLQDPIATMQMTARDLVTHRSGLPRHDLFWIATGLSREEMYHRLRYLQPSQPFRSTFQYQNLMFMTAGLLAERITGRTWEELVHERIFVPLDMERSNFSVEDMQRDEDFSYPYSEVGDEVARIPYRNIDEIGPAGSINSSVNEMMRYVQLHLDYGKRGEKSLLSEANARQMQSPQMVLNGPLASRFAEEELGEPAYGLGLMVSTYRGHRYVFHGGGIDGFISAMEWLPRERIGVVVLTNFSGNNPVPSLVARTVFDRLLGVEPIDWAARARVRQAEAKKSEEEAKQKEQSDRKEGTSPTHQLADYAAEYEHPGYGRAKVTVNGGSLVAYLIGFEVPLEHYHYDIFAVPEELAPPLDAMGGTKVTFSYDKKGDIDRFAVPLETGIDEIVFTRVAETAMRERAFLEGLVGEYELPGMVAMVELRGDDTLVATIPGQPAYTLLPDRGTTFTIKGLEGFRVEFQRDDGVSEARGLIFHQPNGSVFASRR